VLTIPGTAAQPHLSCCDAQMNAIQAAFAAST
jgi:hypothetical protein